jgi:hypothetical protein
MSTEHISPHIPSPCIDLLAHTQCHILTVLGSLEKTNVRLALHLLRGRLKQGFRRFCKDFKRFCILFIEFLRKNYTSLLKKVEMATVADYGDQKPTDPRRQNCSDQEFKKGTTKTWFIDEK